MKRSSMVAGALLSAAWFMPAAMAQPACVAANASVPAGANTTDRSAPFFIDTTGLDLGTAPPTRNPSNPNYPRAAELPDGTLPPAGAEGNFIIGPTHTPARETAAQDKVPHGTIHSFTFSSKDSVIYNPGMIRDDPPNCRNGSIYAAHTAPGDPSNVIVTTSHPGSWTRTIDVYVPAHYVRGSAAPFIVFGDGGSTGSYPGRDLFTVLDNLIQQHRVPPMIAIGIAAGGQDAQGSERGREYDTVSGAYAEWVEREVLPLVEQHAGVKLTKNPDGRATMGISSSGAAAFTMAWFHPELYHRVLAYSPTMVNQQWPHDTALRGGAWEYHDSWAGPAGPSLSVTVNTLTPSDASGGAPLIPNSPQKPIRFWFEVGDHDLLYPAAVMPDGMHDWVLADESMAKVLAAKGYHYQFVFARNAGHVDRPTVAQTLPSALEWLWKGYPVR
ncbi:MAG: alpha/beta hydrolase-fold protein [Acetobacteraceae bacterium]|nr:alpha/beta hydrolase-fold protein [Acetobacteraceae bacterium]